jgi:hypothetical protein
MHRRVASFLFVVALSPFAGAAEPRLPAKIDLVADFEKFGLPPHRQGERDTCSLFVVTGMANFECDRGEPAGHAALSEEFLIWAANEATGLSG